LKEVARKNGMKIPNEEIDNIVFEFENLEKEVSIVEELDKK
jgi:hypothetical protein